MSTKALKKERLAGLFLSREEVAAVSHSRRPDLATAEEQPSTRYSLAVNIHIARKQRGWTQAELAKRAKLSLRTVHGIETAAGDSAPNTDTVDSLAKALGVSVSKLVERRKETEVFV